MTACTTPITRAHGPALRGAMAILLAAATACGPSHEQGSGVVEAASDPALGPALAATDCTANLVAGNGMTGNGLCQNGLAAQGLTLAALSGTNFASWFNVNPGLSDMVMKYVYRCAARAGTSLNWKNPTTGVTYTWAGGPGLATGWTGGAAATVAEQQVVTACLGALTNKYGVSVTIAVEGRSATGVQIPILPTELATFSVQEGCFFGNLFAGQGVFVGLDHSSWDSKTSSVRGCAIDHQSTGPSIDCPPMYYIDYCAKSCTLDATGTFYETCKFNGVTYKPLTTRLMPSDVYKCGDGVCQMTESCGSGADWNNCKSDCGLCP
jgi:hypothetical protein